MYVYRELILPRINMNVPLNSHVNIKRILHDNTRMLPSIMLHDVKAKVIHVYLRLISY